jgi:hypothetical protein
MARLSVAANLGFSARASLKAGAGGCGIAFVSGRDIEYY